MTAETDPESNASAPESEDALLEAEAKPPWRKIALLALVMAVFLGVVYLSPLRHYLGKVRELSESIRSLGWMGPLVLMTGVAVLVAVGFPRLVFCVIAGMALGFWSGLFWIQLGTLIGNYALFLVARVSGGEWVRRHLGKRRKLASVIHEEGMTGVILARQLPLPGFFINLTLGMLSIRHRDFILGSAIGQLPQAIPCTLIGAGVVKASFGKSVGVIALAVALAVLVWIAMKRLLRSQHHPHHSNAASIQPPSQA